MSGYYVVFKFSMATFQYLAYKIRKKNPIKQKMQTSIFIELVECENSTFLCENIYETRA